MLSPTEGLRARKKRETDNAIEQAAVALALARGHARVTVADICEHAGVSRSTFFNYVPTREAAIFGRPLPLVSPERFAQIIHDSSDVPLTTALLRIVFASAGHNWVNPEVAAGRLRLAREQPGAAALGSAPLNTLMTALIRQLTAWFEQHPERRLLPETSAEREAGYLVMLLGAGFRAVLADTAGDAALGAEDTVLLEEDFEAAIDEIQTAARRRHGRGKESS